MDTLSVLAAGGMKARMNALDLLANNIANGNTPGFKADREFYDVFVSTDAAAGEGRPAEITDVRRHWIDLSQGSIVATGNPTDLAISGKGFLQVEGPTGPLLTRTGSLRVSQAGELVTAEGYKVKDDAGQPIRIDARAAFTVAADGTVNQAGRVLGRIALVDIAKADVLTKQGNGYFRLSNVSALQKASAAELQQGKLEAANLAPAESAVRLVTVMRQFEMLQKAAAIGADMNRRAVEEVARVNG